MIIKYVQQQISEYFPHNPTKEQITALETLTQFLFSKEDQVFVLAGYAGTGKTSLVGATIKALTKLQQKAVLLAPTGRAAKVFADYSEQKAYTIHKKIYRQKTFSSDYSGFSLAPNLHKDTFFFVDEASMIPNSRSGDSTFGSGQLLEDLIQYIFSGENCKLILIGDSAQLPPVSEKESPALDIDRLKLYASSVEKITLTQVVRQDSNSGILYNATLIREKLMRSQTNHFPKLQTTGFSDLTKTRGEYLLDAISQAYSRDGIEQTMIICPSNKRAVMYNKGVRNQILCYEEAITSGDRLLVVKNNYFWADKLNQMDFIANGEIIEVVRYIRSVDMYGFHFSDIQIRFEDYELELDVKILLDTLESELPALSKEQNEQLFHQVWEDYFDERTKAKKLKKIKADPFFNAIQIKYAYAITCHKAQGGQWENVFLDIGYINQNMMNENFYRWLYTAITRAKKHLYLVNLPKEFDEEETNKSS